MIIFFIKQKTAYEMRISDWSSDVCSSDLEPPGGDAGLRQMPGIDPQPFRLPVWHAIIGGPGFGIAPAIRPFVLAGDGIVVERPAPAHGDQPAAAQRAPADPAAGERKSVA